MSTQKKIFLVDDHIVVRAALKELIEKVGDYSVIAEYDTGKELIDDYPYAQEPDLIILDLSMPEMDGLEVVEWMKQQQITTRVLVLTLEANDEKITRLFRLGIRGYLQKSCSAVELRQAIHDILNSGYYHNEILTQALTSNSKPADSATQVLQQLNENEMKFLMLLCDEREFTYEQMADTMSVNKRTLEHWRSVLFEKCNVKSKSGLLMFAIKHKLVAI